ncbi:MAG: LCP family protein [Chloroflexota bacterium]
MSGSISEPGRDHAVRLTRVDSATTSAPPRQPLVVYARGVDALEDRAHAIRIRPDTGSIDRRRLAAAGLSGIVPGLGQLFNRRPRLGALFLVPSLALVALAVVLLLTQSPARLIAWVVSPQILGTLLVLNAVVLAWRLLAAGQAFLEPSRQGPTGRLGIAGITVIAILVVLPHLVVWRYGTLLGDTFERIFQTSAADAGGVPTGPVPKDGERINVLLVGVDKTPDRTETLTDTMIVASLEPVGKTVSMVSLPRDMIGVPLGNGDVYGPKVNSLLSFADRNPKTFPKGGTRALEDAVGALLGIPIHYYARIDFIGFIAMVDAVGGVDVDVARQLNARRYDGYGLATTGFHLTAGRHHLTGPEALAYARIRKGAGETDFTRAARQQDVIVALRNRVTSGGGLFWQLPTLLDAVANTIRTDVPTSRLPELAAIVDEVGSGDVVRVVIGHPLVSSANTRFGASLVPNLAAIRAVAAKLFSAPGTPPVPWPTPNPSKAPKASPTPGG